MQEKRLKTFGSEMCAPSNFAIIKSAFTFSHAGWAYVVYKLNVSEYWSDFNTLKELHMINRIK